MAEFLPTLQKVLAHEGGYVNDSEGFGRGIY